ncbi:MAG TPA: hypothetical protein VNE16_15445 [Vicinamibacterales bacterium]|nr:hypothetical protein [Vicinamibacterales bacterium]
MSIVFGMVSTRQSRDFTPVALESFFRLTPPDAGSEFLLIDNDGSLAGHPAGVTLITNESPRGFAANMNLVLRRAHERRADAVLLNNDLVFTTDWFAPLAADRDAIVSPVSNTMIEIPAVGGLHCVPDMELADYIGHERDLEVIADRNRRERSGYLDSYAVAFFCVKIPFAVIDRIGWLDEEYGKGGAEDKDYCVRALRAGFAIRFALGSYVLHFYGKSTWRGGESSEETRVRNETFMRRFLDKWGVPMFHLFMLNSSKPLDTPELRQAWTAGRFQAVIEEMLRRRQAAGA